MQTTVLLRWIGWGLMLGVLGACGGSSSSGTASATPPAAHNSVAAATIVAPVTACPNGGIGVQTGVDTNGNGVLDASEVTATQYVCNGASGPPLLAVSTPVPSNATCPAGGVRIDIGIDANADSQLTGTEIQLTQTLCNGAAGTPGSAGTPGVAGTPGANGISSLMLVTAEPPGNNCVLGGVRIDTGLDNGDSGGTANDGLLQPGEVDHTQYACTLGTGVSEGSLAAPALLTPNTGRLASVAAGGSSYYRFTAADTMEYTISLTGTDSDLKWTLYSDAAFSAVVTACDTVTGTNGREVCTTPLLASGATYYLKVQELSNIPNLFNLRVAEPYLLLSGDDQGNFLTALNPVTGEETPFIATFTNVTNADCAVAPCRLGFVGGLAFEPGGGKILAGMNSEFQYAGYPGEIMSIDPATGAATLLVASAAFPQPSPQQVQGMTLRADQTLFFATQATSDVTGAAVYKLTVAAPTPSFVGALTLNQDSFGDGMAFDEAGKLWLENGRGLYLVDPVSGAATFTGQVFGGSGSGNSQTANQARFRPSVVPVGSAELDSLAVNPADGRMYFLNEGDYLGVLDPLTRSTFTVGELFAFHSGLTAVPLRALKASYAPTQVAASNLDSQTVLVNWKALMPPGTTYHVYYSLTSGVTPQNGTPATVSEPTFVLNGLADGVPVYFVVTALVPGLPETAPSTQVTATPAAISTAGSQLLVTSSIGDVYSLNPGSAPTLVKHMTKDSNSGGTPSGILVNLGPVGALIRDSRSGAYYAGTTNANSNPGKVFTMDLTTGVATQLVGVGNTEGIWGMAQAPGGTVFITYINCPDLDTVNLSTGALTELASLNTCGDGYGLSFDGAGSTLYLAAGQNFYAVNQTTAVTTLSAAMSFVGFPVLDSPIMIDMTPRPGDGTLFGILVDNNGSGSHYLVKLDPVTGVVTNLGRTTDGFDGLLWSAPISPS